MNSLESLIKELKTDGLMGINNLLVRKQTEQYFVDFKLTKWEDYSGKKNVAPDDINNLAKAISGFGNSEGGILIWGVDTKGESDHANSLRPIKSPHHFLSLLNSSVSRTTVPAHTSTEFFVINDTDPDKGYVVTVIPKYEGLPIQTIEQGKFHMRAGDSFIGIPHAILSGMFGRRPNPNVASMYTLVEDQPLIDDHGYIKFDVGIQLVNGGKGIARDLFLNCSIFGPGESSSISFEFTDQNFTAYSVFGVQTNLISQDNIRLAPGQRLQPLTLRFFLKPPFKEFTFKLTVGASDQVPYDHESVIDAETLQNMYDKCIVKVNKDFASELLKMNTDRTN